MKEINVLQEKLLQSDYRDFHDLADRPDKEHAQLIKKLRPNALA